MSCPNATAPIDITNNNSSICDLKCNYNFNYSLSNLNVTNRGEYLSMRVDKSNSAPVTFNAESYEIEEARLYRPSLHTYGGSKADAELIILHNNNSGSGSLMVCIPIIVGVSSNDSVSLFDSILLDVAKTANSYGKQTIINISTFTFNKFIPIQPFYSYSGTLPYSPCNGNYNYVVFSKDDSNVYMSPSAFTLFTKLTTANKYSTKKNKGGLFFNKKGVTTTSSDKGDIYIECLPTGSSGETLVPTPISSSSFSSPSFDFNMVYGNIIFSIIIGIVVLLALTKLASIIFGKLFNTTSGGGQIVGGGRGKHLMKLFNETL
jgi:carbonic anhydrase